MSNTDRLMAALAPIFGEGELDVDDALIERIGDSLDEITTDEIRGEMTADSSFSTEFHGREGLQATWADWLETFKRVRLELEEVFETGENVVTFVNQTGTTRHGVDVEQPSAAVWKFRDGELVRIEFHLDRDKALASAQEPG